MLVQLLRNSFTVLRRPTIKTFQAINIDNWQWPLLYMAIGQVLTWLILVLSINIHAPALEKFWSKTSQAYGSQVMLSLNHELQKPFVFVGIRFFWFIFGIFIWFLLPYWLGRGIGGSESFGKFFYNNAIFLAPIGILISLSELALNGFDAWLYLLVYFSLNIFCSYLLYINLRSTLELPKIKSLLVVVIPLLILFITVCGLFTLLIFALILK